MTCRARQLLTTAGLALGLVVALPGSPAFADPAGPTDYRSEIDSLEPAPAGVDVEVVGSDSFLRVAAEPGHSVVVVGYWDEPYARINEDGTVEINQASPSVVQNTSRFGVLTDDTVDASAPPRWEATGERGEIVWHDHRSHWMATTKATISGPDGLVQHWELPLVVDGSDVVVRGSLYRHGEPTVLWWVLALPFAVVAALVARARAPMVAALGGVIAVGGAIDRLSLPSDARPAWAAVALGAIAAVAGLAALVGRRSWWSSAILAGGGAALAVAGYVQRVGVTRAFIPGPTPDWLVRLTTVGAVGTGIVAFVTALLATVGVRFDLLFGSRPRPVASDA